MSELILQYTCEVTQPPIVYLQGQGTREAYQAGIWGENVFTSKGTHLSISFGSNYPSLHPSIYYFIHSISKHLPNAWHYAKCYGYKDKT